MSEANDRLLDIITKMKKILGVECEDKMLPAILDEMLTMSEVSGGLSLADLAKALRDGAELAEEAKKALIMVRQSYFLYFIRENYPYQIC